ncbi:PEP-CTERM sorting domain-containing protein [Massilia sp. erpn]|uniref:PEP-CTERM sorting domain-containing protein n=1 Tax=Massilia sp. erpn TaxID=2738142 RepID=UPI0021074620|nr:PEP-CTERM sorting domain-containing protein [Massilia sp. erpn]UTY57509.1 PEP-CTERM sorting domain-containing protein [Massilia sp. erpn]
MRLPALVFAALTAVSASASAAILTFDVSSSNSFPNQISIETQIVEAGARFNLQKRDIYYQWNWRPGQSYLSHYTVTSYDVFGSLRDNFSILGSVTSNTEVINGTIKWNAAELGRLSNPAPKLEFRVSAPGSSSDPALSSTWGPGNNATNLFAMRQEGGTIFDRRAETALPKDADSLAFTYVGTGFNTVMVRDFSIYGPEYDPGIHHFLGKEEFVGLIPVPEPSSWMLMLGGLTILGVAIRQRKRT